MYYYFKYDCYFQDYTDHLAEPGDVIWPWLEDNEIIKLNEDGDVRHLGAVCCPK